MALSTGEHKGLAVMHPVPTRAANLASRYAADMLSPSDAALLEASCSLLTDLVFDGPTWLECPQNTDAACALAEKISDSLQAARVAELRQGSL